MKLLLDTHTFIWLTTGSNELSPKARQLIEDLENRIFLSVISIWEILLKVRVGKLEVGGNLDSLVRNQVENNSVEILPLQAEHVYGIEKLEDIHKDPFDRLLIAQAKHEGACFLTKDAHILRYNVETAW